MTAHGAPIAKRRAIVDRRALADRLAQIAQQAEPERNMQATGLLKQALAAGRSEIAGRIEARPWQGSEAAAAYAFLADQIVRLAYDYIAGRLLPAASSERSE